MGQRLELQNPQFGKDEWRAVGKEIYKRRKQRKWTQEDLAGFMDSDHRVVSRHENGVSMSVETLVKYASVFECSIDSLLPEYIRNEKPQGITSQLLETLYFVATLSEEQQLAINKIILGGIDLVKQAS